MELRSSGNPFVPLVWLASLAHNSPSCPFILQLFVVTWREERAEKKNRNEEEKSDCGRGEREKWILCCDRMSQWKRDTTNQIYFHEFVRFCCELNYVCCVSLTGAQFLDFISSANIAVVSCVVRIHLAERCRCVVKSAFCCLLCKGKTKAISRNSEKEILSTKFIVGRANVVVNVCVASKSKTNEIQFRAKVNLHRDVCVLCCDNLHVDFLVARNFMRKYWQNSEKFE